MNSIRWTAMAVSLVLAAIATAGEPMHARFAIAIDDGSGPMAVDLDSDTMGFGLDELQVGETRAIVDEAGRNIMITRTAGGLALDVDGKKIDLPMPDDGHGITFVSDDATDVEVQVLHDASYATAGGIKGVTIISAGPIDEATRESLRAVLISSGHSGDVTFIDQQAGDAVHGVTVIRKNVEITH